MANEIEKYQYNKLMGKINTVLNNLEDYIQNLGAIRKFTEAGTYTFKIPVGVTSILVSGIAAGGGGGGGGGEDGWRDTAGSGGGGGGYGEYVIDRTIAVTPGETLTVIVGANGTGGAAGQNGFSNSSPYPQSGQKGGDGGNTILKRETTALLTLTGGTGGGAGVRGNTSDSHTVAVGGSGGITGGANGDNTTVPTGSGTTSAYYLLGAGGAGGSTSYFGEKFGQGGSGGDGGGHKTYQGSLYKPVSGSDGTGGAFAICFGQGNNYNAIEW